MAVLDCSISCVESVVRIGVMVGTGMCPTTMTMTHRKGPLLTSTFKDNIHSIMFSDSQQIQQLDDLTIHYTKNIPIAGPSDAISSKSPLQSFGEPCFLLCLVMALMLRWVPCARRDHHLTLYPPSPQVTLSSNFNVASSPNGVSPSLPPRPLP